MDQPKIDGRIRGTVLNWANALTLLEESMTDMAHLIMEGSCDTPELERLLVKMDFVHMSALEVQGELSNEFWDFMAEERLRNQEGN